jgi:hypothetical protein
VNFSSDLSPRQKVMIDGDRSLVGVVTSYQFRPVVVGKTIDGAYVVIEVSYLHNGEAKTDWIERDRLQVVA